MEKVGMNKEDLLENLRCEEANLMQRIQAIMSDPAKTASDKSQVESRLYQVRQKITELDGAKQDV